jgi:hypothetical protein
MSATVTLPAAPPVAPVAPATPRPYRWTCAAFGQAAGLGLFEGRRPLLIDGALLEQGPMNHPHAVAVSVAQSSLMT